MPTYETQIVIDVVVHYDKVKGSRGHTDGRFGPKITPDEPPYIDVYRVVDANSQTELELTERQRTEITDEIAEHLSE